MKIKTDSLAEIREVTTAHNYYRSTRGAIIGTQAREFVLNGGRMKEGIPGPMYYPKMNSSKKKPC